MSAAFRYLRPDKMMTRDAAVTGTVDSAYEAGWLCDLRPGFPVRGPDAGTLSLAIVGNGTPCDFAAATHLRIDDDVNLVLTGDVSATLSARGGVQADGIPLNRWTTFASSGSPGASHVTLSATGNDDAIIIGELFIGDSDTLPQPLFLGAPRGFQSFAIQPNSEFSSVLGYYKGLFGETLSGSLVVNDDELEAIVQWFKSCENGTLPSVIVPDDTVDACLVVRFTDLKIDPIAPGDADGADSEQALYSVTLTFEEFPRTTW